MRTQFIGRLNMMTAAILCLGIIICGEVVKAQEYQGKDLALKSCGFETSNLSWTMDETGFVGTYIIQPTSGKISFSIVASGDGGAGSPPVMDVHIGGEKWTYTVTGNNQTFAESDINMPVGTHAIRIELTRGSVGFDRRLTIHSFQVTDSAGLDVINNFDNEVNALNSADSYIDNWRCASYRLKMLDGSGATVEAGKQIRVRLKRHAFNFGVCLPGVNMRAKWLGDDVNGQTFRQKVTQQPMFSMFGCDNGAKWKQQEGTRDSEYYTYVDEALNFAEENNMRFRWHALMWGSFDPDWANALKLDAQKKITITGVTHPNLNGTYKFNKPLMSSDVYSSKINNVDYYVYRWKNPANPSEVKWLIGQSNPRKIYFSSTQGVSSPFDVTNWIPENGATGTPTFTHLNEGDASRSELSGELTERIQGVIRQRSQRYSEIDGINESFNVELPIRSLGMDGAAALYDEMGQAANLAASEHGTDAAKIYLNDYNILKGAFNLNRVKWVAPPGSRDWYRNFYRRHVESFLTAGNENTVGGIGIQGHVRGDLPDEDATGTRHITLKTYRKPLQTLSVFEKPISITEFSLDADTSSAWTNAEKYDVVNKAMRVVFGSDQTTTFHYWGFYDSWDGVFTGLYNSDWSLSPVGEAWRDLTADQWATDALLTVDSNGEINVPHAFFGDYIIEGANGFQYNATATLKRSSTNLTVTDGKIANNNPTAKMTAPASDITLEYGQSIRFSGNGYDVEDGVISGNGLVWSSSRDGQFGTGVSLTTSLLSVGLHTIELTSTDSEGLTGFDEITLTITPSLFDSDNDGMSDEWETHYFGAIDHPDGTAGGDWDGDGLSNLSEYIAGTNPLSANSNFQIKIVSIGGGLNVTYSTKVAAGSMYQNKIRYYDLYSSLDLRLNWTPVLDCSNIVSDGEIHAYAIQGDEPRKFFRLKVRLEDTE